MNFSIRALVFLIPAAGSFLIVGCDEKKPAAAFEKNERTRSALSVQRPTPSPTAFTAPSPAPDATTEEVAKEKAPPAPGLKKIDSQILLALKQVQGEPPYNRPGAFGPDVPVIDGARVGVDLHAETSEVFLKYIAAIGGEVVSSPDAPGIVRALIPFAQMAALAGRPEVQSISPTRPSVTRRVNPEDFLQPGSPKTKQ